MATEQQERRSPSSPALNWPPRASVVLLADKVARRGRGPILVRGAAGTPVEKVARFIHEHGAPEAPFVSVRCRGVSETALHHEFFGSGDGPPAPSSAAARARGGTLFVEEITLLSDDSQRRVMELLDGQGDASGGEAPGPARIIMGTSVDIDRAVRERHLRADLFERIAVVTLRLPALAEAPDEVVSLAQALLEDACRRQGRPCARLTPGACAKLAGHGWPDNDRELEGVIERALIVETGPSIPAEALTFVESAPEPAAPAGHGLRVFAVQRAENAPPATLQDIERAYVTWMLGITRGNRTAASRMLGISYPTIMKKIVDYHIDYRALAQRGAKG